MRLIGLTGNIASGKSTVARLLAQHGATIIDADQLAREVVRPGTPALRRIVEQWGEEVLAPDDTLDRAALRGQVFADREQLERLNAIVHPEVERLRERRIEEARARGAPVVICDIPLLFEKHLAGRFDAIILVDAPRPLRLERLVRDRGLHETDAMNMIAAQMPAELKRARSDYIIDNTGTLADLERRVDEVWRAILADGGEAELASAGATHAGPPMRGDGRRG
ncbi:MAG TPA: dephospho-CoA kinase [Gemmatimonadaceae bacterium]|nr:dephospho-CoA kinase [Gemmatimonadaceae bacterium]